MTLSTTVSVAVNFTVPVESVIALVPDTSHLPLACDKLTTLPGDRQRAAAKADRRGAAGIRSASHRW